MFDVGFPVVALVITVVHVGRVRLHVHVQGGDGNRRVGCCIG